MPSIGYYVHHHGAGHLHRARAIARASNMPVTLIGTGLNSKLGLNSEHGLALLNLPDDRIDAAFDGADGASTRPQCVHYAPLGQPRNAKRTAMLADWIADTQPSLLVVDVSVEVALLARLCSVPVVYVRLSGTRTDQPHLEAFRSAAALLSPFHRDLDADAMPDWVKAKTSYFPGIGPVATPVEPDCVAQDGLVLFVLGKGSGENDTSRFCAIAAANPAIEFQVAGLAEPDCAPPDNMTFLGWVDPVAPLISRARCVIGGAGDGLVVQVLASGVPFVCLPEDRPFDEQRCKGLRLAATGAALVLNTWPAPQDWPALIDEAIALAPHRPAALHEPSGARNAARWLEALAVTGAN